MTDTTTPDRDAPDLAWTGLGLRRLVEREQACTVLHDTLLLVAAATTAPEDRGYRERTAARWLVTARAAAAEAAVLLGRGHGRCGDRDCDPVTVTDRRGLVGVGEQLAVALLAREPDPDCLGDFDDGATDDDELGDVARRLVDAAGEAAGAPTVGWTGTDFARALAALPKVVAEILAAGRLRFLRQVVEDAENAHAATRDRLAAAADRLHRAELDRDLRREILDGILGEVARGEVDAGRAEGLWSARCTVQEAGDPAPGEFAATTRDLLAARDGREPAAAGRDRLAAALRGTGILPREAADG